MTLLEPQQKAKDIRARLLRPTGGRVSEEIEIIAPPTERRIRIEQAKAIEEARRAEADFRRREAIDNQIRKALQDRAEAQRIAERLVAEDKPLPKPPSIQRILSAVSREFGVPIVDLLSQRRTAGVVLPRQIVMYLARKMTFMSLPQISMRVGGRDHTTCLHAVRKVEALLLDDLDLAARVALVRTKLSTDLVASCVSVDSERGD